MDGFWVDDIFWCITEKKRPTGMNYLLVLVYIFLFVHNVPALLDCSLGCPIGGTVTLVKSRCITEKKRPTGMNYLLVLFYIFLFVTMFLHRWIAFWGALLGVPLHHQFAGSSLFNMKFVPKTNVVTPIA
jgi:hypothetical protein